MDNKKLSDDYINGFTNGVVDFAQKLGNALVEINNKGTLDYNEVISSIMKIAEKSYTINLYDIGLVEYDKKNDMYYD